MVREYIIEQLSEKLLVFDISPSEINDDFDLVKSGLLDSMAFIDLVADTEQNFNLEIDFEESANSADFTTMGGLISMLIMKANE